MNKHPAFTHFLHRLYDACEDTLSPRVLEQLFVWESIDTKEAALSYIMGALAEKGIDDPAQFLQEKGVIKRKPS